MRNLKKTLCLILALVFVLGLCTVGAANVVFDDENEIRYAEAVEAMAGLGILTGDDNDRDGKMEFRPKDGLTRAEAAAIISRVVAGPNIEKWPAKQVFDDVPADHWAAKYIAYCSNRNIINGVGNGNFDPNGKVTLVAVAKMLLASCGYGAKGEFTGEDWIYNVATRALQTPILTGLNNSNLEGAANREETALLSYNTLMNVVRVVLSNNTNSYVAESVNGASNVTLAQTTWGLRTDVGVIVANKTNDSTAKGTILDGESVMRYYVTDEDENPSILGHQVRITYRIETENGSNVAKAYFLEDRCTEVKGADAAKTDDASKVYTFSSGKLASYTVPARSVRATLPGTFVLNEEGKVVAYKVEGYFVSVLTVNYITGQSTVVDPSTGLSVVVSAPAGCVSGDIVTVYHMGDVYTVKPAAKMTNVLIESYQRDNQGNYIYNGGTIYASKAELLSFTSLPGITKLDTSYQQLELGTRCTLYFDAEGGCIGFADKTGSGSSSVSFDSYGMFVTAYSRTDNYGSQSYYAQVILGNGTEANLPISKTTFDSGLVNTVYKLTNYGTQWSMTPAGAAELAYEQYYTGDPLTDFSGATYIYYTGSLADLTLKTNQKPAANSYVYFTYSLVKEGTVYVRKVQSVWFQSSASAPVQNTNYIYVAGTTPFSSALVGGKEVAFYRGYQNGVDIQDFALSAAPAKIGFVNCSKNTSTGVYTITSYVGDGNGKATGVRTVSLVDGSASYYVTPSALGVADADGSVKSMSLSGVKIVKVGDAANTVLQLNTVTDLINTVLSGYTVTITFVEVVSGSSHSIGGSAIYVTSVASGT